VVVDVQEVKTDAVGLLSFSYSHAAVAAAVASAPSAAHHAVTQDVVPLSGFYLSFAAVAVAAVFSKNPANALPPPAQP